MAPARAAPARTRWSSPSGGCSGRRSGRSASRRTSGSPRRCRSPSRAPTRTRWTAPGSGCPTAAGRSRCAAGSRTRSACGGRSSRGASASCSATPTRCAPRPPATPCWASGARRYGAGAVPVAASLRARLRARLRRAAHPRGVGRPRRGGRHPARGGRPGDDGRTRAGPGGEPRAARAARLDVPGRPRPGQPGQRRRPCGAAAAPPARRPVHPDPRHDRRGRRRGDERGGDVRADEPAAAARGAALRLGDLPRGISRPAGHPPARDPPPSLPWQWPLRPAGQRTSRTVARRTTSRPPGPRWQRPPGGAGDWAARARTSR